MQRSFSQDWKTIGFSGVSFLLIYFVSLIASVWVFQRTWMSESRLANNPPWYYIGQDLVQGWVHMGGLVLCLGLALLRRRRDPVGTWMMLWMSCLWMGSLVGQAIYVMVRSRDLWNPARASTAWATFDEYHGDPVQYVIFFLGPIGGLLLASCGRKYWCGGTTEQRSAADETPSVC